MLAGRKQLYQLVGGFKLYSKACCHFDCLKLSSEAVDMMVCTLCLQQEMMDKERRGTKMKTKTQGNRYLFHDTGENCGRQSFLESEFIVTCLENTN